MTIYELTRARLQVSPKTWLITGVAGFIGSNLLETLLKLDQVVVGLDNFSTGNKRNLESVKGNVMESQWARFRLIEADVRTLDACHQACSRVDYVLHEAALGSVPRSLQDPIASNEANITGFLNVAVAARDANTDRFVYAASSSTYGDHPALPKVEETIGRPLSPYAVTKLANELYANVFSRCYGLKSIGLRYFNVFGPRQTPNGPYAAVIPRWIEAMIHNQTVHINGDGKTSRDFCYVANIVQANILAATTTNLESVGQVFNVATGRRTSLNELFTMLKERLHSEFPHLSEFCPEYGDFRAGDVRHSQASIDKAKTLIGYLPTHEVKGGLEESLKWYVQNLSSPNERIE